MNDPIHNFLNRLDTELVPFAADGACLDMFLLGRSALVVSYGFTLTTKDIDMVSMQQTELEKKAVELAGKGKPLAESLGFYLDPVPQALPPLPGWFRHRSMPIPGAWKVLRLWKLEVHDLAVTKLKSFRPQDREDLQTLCDRGLLRAEQLRESLDKAFPFRSPKPEDVEDDPDTPEWGKALANLKRVEAYLQGSIASL